MRNTKNVVLSGILCAVALILLFISSFSFVFDYSVLVLSSVVILVAVIEMSPLWGILVYLAVSILSFFLLPIRDTKFLFIFFIGYYPVIKSIFEKLNNRVLEFILKILAFNIGVGLCVYIFWSLFFTKDNILTPLIMAGGVIVVNLVFLLYDIALSKVATYYIYKIKPRLKYIK